MVSKGDGFHKSDTKEDSGSTGLDEQLPQEDPGLEDTE